MALLTLCIPGTLSAQDLIVKTDATQVEAKVLEISPEQVRYKRFSNPDGPTYVLPAGTIDYIRYANGETEHFRPASPKQATEATQPTEEQLAQTPKTLPADPPFFVMEVPSQGAAASAAPADPAQTPKTLPADPPVRVMPVPQQAEVRYNIGDFYDVDGVRGIVCMLNETGTHGLILSLDQIFLPWSTFAKPDLRQIGTDEMDDGRVNMARVAAYIAEHGASWEEFPAFKWCADHGDGWYLPAANEMLVIGNNFNGGNRLKFNRAARNLFNDALKRNGGSKMDRLVYYFSSTEKDAKMAYTSHMDIEPPYAVEIQKYAKYLVRAVHRF